MKRFQVKVKPGSKRACITGDAAGGYVACVKSPPDKGKANQELVRLFKDELGMEVRIVSGFTGRKKVIEIY